MPPIVLLGTGTDVGKTYVTAALTRLLRELAPDRPVLALKPVESGHPPPGAPPAATDAAALAAASNVPSPTPNPLYALTDPVSPHLAARREGRNIDLAAIHSWATTALPYNTLLLIETAGGAFSPLSETTTNADLAQTFDPAIWILVAPDALGVLHDVRATIAALTTHTRAPDHLVLTASRPPDPSTGTNAAELSRLGLPAPYSLPPNDSTALLPLARLLLS